MQKEKRWHTQRLRNLVVICTLLAMLLGVTTYAWFVGLQEVNVTNFEVEIAAIDGLSLSLDGVTFSESVTPTISTDGLKPMSSIGEMDIASSRMKIYEKASYTATTGGFRLITSLVDNEEEEQDGYVEFDLYIKNESGTEYDETWTEADEEGIYLTTNSAVAVGSAGVEETGIENSIRVAFAQIGRVKATTETVATITGITCVTDQDGNLTTTSGVTGICRTAQIWEPNDTAHVDNAISWYKEACLERTGADVYTENECNDVVGTVNTYAVKDVIKSADKVNVYDGEDYNGYTGTTKLEAYDYYTDTEKLEKSTARTEFITLAANSITKIRVYVYLEGQDIDNYEFSAIGKMVSINFGFTKQRFTPEDIDYEENGGPAIPDGEEPETPEEPGEGGGS